MSDAGAFVVEDEATAHGLVRHLVLNRPDKLNALDLDQHVRIKAAVESATDEENVRVVCLSGRGRAFCAGDDLTARSTPEPDPLEGRRVDLDLGSGPTFLLESAGVLRHCPLPTVVLLHGHALGSGYDYSLSCDFRLATEDVNYGDPRIHRALWAAEGWSYKLPRLVHQSAVTPIAYLGETMNGAAAHACGLVHAVFPAGCDLRAAAKPFLNQLAALSPAAYRETKALILAGVDQDFASALAHARSAAA